MSDPFADIDGIIQAQEEEVPLAKSTLLGGDAASGGDEISYLERFPRELQSKAALDMKYRMEMEKAIHSAMIELHDVREQLYLVRFDGSRSQEECKKAVENYICEIERLEAKVTKLREKLLENYMKSLSLDQLRMSGPLITTSLRHNRSMIPQSGGSSQMGLKHIFLFSSLPLEKARSFSHIFLTIFFFFGQRGYFQKDLFHEAKIVENMVELCQGMNWKGHNLPSSHTKMSLSFEKYLLVCWVLNHQETYQSLQMWDTEKHLCTTQMIGEV